MTAELRAAVRAAADRRARALDAAELAAELAAGARCSACGGPSTGLTLGCKTCSDRAYLRLKLDRDVLDREWLRSRRALALIEAEAMNGRRHRVPRADYSGL